MLARAEMGRAGLAAGGLKQEVADLRSAPVSTQVLIFLGTSDNGERRLAFCLALLAKKSPDLALLVERWDEIPGAIRAGMVAIVKAVGAAPRPWPSRPER
jgi:hypothetical protein